MSKGKTEKAKNKKKESAKALQAAEPVVDMTSFTVSAPPRPLSPSPALSNGLVSRNSDSPAPSAMMKSSFSQVYEPASGSGTPVTNSSDRTKVAFGLKRKAAEDMNGTPPLKRR